MSFASKPTKFLFFEIARLRTLYDSKPEIREAIIERYGQVVKELDGRGAKWFWVPHPMDQFIDIKKAFVKPNKPAWRIFTPEEVFGITGFELPVLVDIKIDGMRLQIHNEDGVKIFSEDEGFNKTSKFKDPLEDIKKLPEGTILDAEGVLVADGQVLHRTSFIGYVNGKGFDEEKDKQTEFWVFDVFKWAGKDLMDEPLSVRLSYLKKVPGAGHLKTFKIGEESFICKTREEVLSAIKKVAGKKGSEGAMIKVLSSKYVRDIHNKGWIKLKNLKEVDCLVVEIEQPKHLKGPLQGQSVEGVYNYHVAAGPYSDADGKVLLDKVPTKVREYERKVYAHLGKTFNTEIRVKVGDIIRVWSPEINKYEVKGTDLFTYGIYEPKVLEWVHERDIPDSLNVLNRLAEETSELHPRGVVKQDEGGNGGHWVTVNGRYIFIGDEEQGSWEVNYDKMEELTKEFMDDQEWLVKDGDWITVNGKHILIGEGEDFEQSLHGPKISISREANTRSYSLEGGKGKADVDIYGKDFAVIDIIEVPEKERGKGYGRYIVNRVEADLRESGVKVVHVSAVASAIPFWDKLGYKTHLEKPDVSNLSPRSASAKLELWEGKRSKDLVKPGKSEESIGITKAESNAMYLPRHSCMLIWSGVKTLIVKEKHFEGMLKKKLNLCDDNYKYGDIILTRMFEMSREEVDRSRKRSKLTDLDMEDWKGARTFYGYDFEFEPLEEPQEVKVPHGAQTFFNIEKVEGPILPEYEELAKPGEPLPDKYYKFHAEVKIPRFVLQRHYPTGKKIPIKPGEDTPQIHKSFVVEYDEKHPEALTSLMSDLIDQYEELDEKERNKIEKSRFGVLFDSLVIKIRDHLDLRMEISDSRLVGVTIHPPVPGGITAWDAFKSRMDTEEKTQVTPKYEHPHPWLTREGELRFPTRHENVPEQTAHYLEVARMDIIDTGPVKFGVQRDDLHEYFFYGKILKGRWVIRKLKIGTEAAHWAWLLMKPSDQRPLDPVLHRDKGTIKIERVSEPTAEEREHIEEETQAARAERGQEI